MANEGTSSNTFRGGQTTSTTSATVDVKDQAETANVEIEPPFTDYRKMKHYPFLVDYYKLGDTWQDKLGGFEQEVDFIEGYFKDKIEQGEMQNDTQVVKDEIKKIYRLVGIDKSERTTMQIEKLSAYIKFLKETDKIELLRYKYR